MFWAFKERTNFIESELIKLSDYMRENNLKIKSGQYGINQAWTFEKYLDVLEFEKID